MDAPTREHTRDDVHDREPKPARFGRSHRRMWLVGAFIVLGLSIGAGGVAWWLQARQFETTDDAFIDSRVVSISPQVSGAIVNVAVTDTELLDEGAKLVSIDDRDYRAAFEQADAQVDQAEATMSNIDAQIEAQRAKIDQAENEVVETQGALTFAQQENDRYQELFRTGVDHQACNKNGDDNEQQYPSEGLSVIVVDALAFGGQAGASARIQNYLGFPIGISGQELTGRAFVQAQKFGAEMGIPVEVVGLDASGAPLGLGLSNGRRINARSVVIASGARYRKPVIPHLQEFEGHGGRMKSLFCSQNRGGRTNFRWVTAT